LLFRVSLGPCPSLHRLRDRLPGFHTLRRGIYDGEQLVKVIDVGLGLTLLLLLLVLGDLLIRVCELPG
jgi:hypothetical protein